MKKISSVHYPLHITISALFIALILFFGVVLGYYNYSKTSDILLSTTDSFFDQLAKELSLNQMLSRRPVAQAITMLGASGIDKSGTLSERLQFLPQFKAALEVADEMTALQVGYGNGDYFIVRSLSSDFMRKQFSAPDGSSFVVDNIRMQTDEDNRLERIWYSSSLVELKRALPAASSYDPRIRPWYKAALASRQVVGVDPYLFYFTRKVGITLAYKNPLSDAVVAGDITLEGLSKRISETVVTDHSEVAMLHSSGMVIGYRDPSRLVIQQGADSFRLATLEDMKNELLSYVGKNFSLDEDQDLDFTFAGEEWVGGVRKLESSGSNDYLLLMLSPKSELLALATRIQKRAVLITAIMILLTIPLTWLAARLISTPLRQLAAEVDQINRLDFHKPIDHRSIISEVDELANAMGMMKETIDKFLRLIKSLASEQNFDEMLRLITRETMSVSHGSGAATFLVNDKDGSLYPALMIDEKGQEDDATLLPSFQAGAGSSVFSILEEGKTKVVSEHSAYTELFSLIRQGRKEPLGSVLVFPLQNRTHEGIGLLCIFFDDVEDFTGKDQQARKGFLQTFAGMAAVSLEGRKLLKMQKQLLESFITLLAGAIDSKSPYTGGHCQRVPVLTKLLARKACEAEEGVYADFDLSQDEWEALHMASWLHDCGKVTTPEYVVDKSTKLETIYDRIHEVRMRFEVLYRDAELHLLRELTCEEERNRLQQRLEETLEQLQKEFAFIAECNLGGEFMAPDRAERLEQIGKRAWIRHFDDRIGISWEEKQRKDRTEPVTLPVQETLLADKEEHLIEHPDKQDIQEENGDQFNMVEPPNMYNRGELYNLKIARGTLNEEERYRINNHIVQTIIMLNRLPYPKYLSTVPEIAGGHHEKMDGTGYPRGLRGSEMSPQARMMVIADIFEALTASDRPYKKAKKLSEALKIMSFMEKDNHIDPELFRLFLTSGAYLEYAGEYLDPDQIDDVRIEDFVS